jgi:2,5-diamino-6-(ribosylamino)-4(3H)-pyrimidinone 5'-phosphate reductase
VTSNLPLPAVLRTLREKGIRSIMVEGGARIIQSFLSAASGHLVDALIVTTAPILVGCEGVGYGERLEQVPGLSYISTGQVGRDTVVGLKLTS